jgi:hypothetical protein
MMRSIGPKLLILLVLACLGTFAWMTRVPESPWIEEAQEWPVVGELARKFRIAYLGPEAAGGGSESFSGEAAQPGSEAVADRRSTSVRSTPTAVEQDIQVVRPPMTEPIPLSGPVAVEESTSSSYRPPVRLSPPGAAAPAPAPAPIAYKALEWGWRLPGQPVLAAADSAAEVVAVLDAMAYLPVLAHEGQWAEVRYRDLEGWIDTLWQAPHQRRGAGRGVLRHRLEPVKASDSTRLREARKKYGLREAEIDLGAYTLFTDVEDEELLDFLAGAAAAA